MSHSNIPSSAPPPITAVVGKANQLISLLAPLGLNHLRLLSYCLAHYDSRSPENLRFTAKVKDLVGIFKGMGQKTAYDVVRQAVIDINSKPLRIKFQRDGKSVEGIYFWFSGMEYIESEGVFIFSLGKEIAPYLLELKGEFTRYRLENVYQFKSASTWKLYENLKQWESNGCWKVMLPELKERLGIAGKYPRWAIFNDVILKKSLAEIADKSDIQASIRKIKNNKIVVGVEFYISKILNSNFVANIGDTANDYRVLYEQGLNKIQVQNLSRLAKDASKDLEYFLKNVLTRWEAKPIDKRGNKSAYIYGALADEFSPKLFTDEQLELHIKPSKRVEDQKTQEMPHESDIQELTDIKSSLAAVIKFEEFETWIKPLQMVFKGKTATFIAPNRFFLNCVKKKYNLNIEEAAREHGFSEIIFISN